MDDIKVSFYCSGFISLVTLPYVFTFGSIRTNLDFMNGKTSYKLLQVTNKVIIFTMQRFLYKMYIILTIVLVLRRISKIA